MRNAFKSAVFSLALASCTGAGAYQPSVQSSDAEQFKQCQPTKTTRENAVEQRACLSDALKQSSERAGFPPMNLVRTYAADTKLMAVQYSEGNMSEQEFDARIEKATMDLRSASENMAKSQAETVAVPTSSISPAKVAAGAFLKDISNSIQQNNQPRSIQLGPSQTTNCQPNGYGGMRCVTQ